jgi:hypothetical protein
MKIGLDEYMSFGNKKQIPEILRELGIGPSMYLLLIKGLRNLYLMLTLINIPIMYIYASGQETSRLAWTSDKIFGSFNHGNLGQDNLSLFHYPVWSKNSFEAGKWIQKNSLNINCGQERLQQISSIGLTDIPNTDKSISNFENQRVQISSSGKYTVSNGYWTMQEIK